MSHNKEKEEKEATIPMLKRIGKKFDVELIFYLNLEN